jgi:SAM-dependent methyltransferase
MHSELLQTRGERELLDANRRFYDLLWSDAQLIEPQRFNTWPLVRSLLPQSARRLEVGPGLRPRLPIEGTQFVDISAPALAQLRERGGHAVLSQVTALPFVNGAFDLVCALDIIEHVEDEDGALRELSRVAKAGATLLLSVPLHPSLWTAFDDFVGHKRRYEPARLRTKLTEHHLVVERSALFGMQPRSSRLVDIGMWWLTHHRERAMWWYNRVFVPLALRFQKELQLAPGMIAADGVDEVLLVCRTGATPRHSNDVAVHGDDLSPDARGLVGNEKCDKARDRRGSPRSLRWNDACNGLGIEWPRRN